MLLLALILLPAIAAAIAYALPVRQRAQLLTGTGVVHLALTALLWATPGATALEGWLADDALGRLVLTLVSVLFLAVAQYSGALPRELKPRGGRAFASCLLAFLGAASLVALSHHLAVQWMGLEATTLSVAPLIYHRRDRRSLEAVWKYLVLSSVGIAFALLGVFLLSTAQPMGTAGGRPLVLDDMLAHAAAFDPIWLRASFVFILIGYGTKMGLAPMHAWKPDTYGEAPSLVGALMAGALTSCAFLGLARVTSVCFAAGAGAFVRPALIGFGLFSLAVAAAFIIVQGDIKRLLAYSSVEHMGLLVIGLGVGGVGAYGTVLHALNNGFAKGLMFLAVGNVVLATGTSASASVHRLASRLPVSATLLVGGLFAITGAPPFGMFISEFAIVQGAIGERHPWVAAMVLLLLAVIFVGIAAMILEMVYGMPKPGAAPASERNDERRGLVVAPVALGMLVLLLGVYIPAPLAAALSSAAALLGGHAP